MRAGAAARTGLALALLAGALLLPAAPGEGLRPVLPLEAAGAALLLAIIGGGPGFAPLRWAMTAAAAALVFLKLADIGSGLAFSRPFNPLLDLPLLVSGWQLLSASVGQGEALAAVAGALLLWLGAAALLFWALGGARRLSARGRRRLGLVSAAGLAIGGGAAALLPGAPASFDALPSFGARAALMARSVADLARFERALGQDPLDALPRDTLFAALAGKDVVVLFVESYGRSAVEDPRYAPATRARLEAAESALTAAGLAARSGWLASPVAGGQSWLAHATLLSGLDVSDQGRHDRLIASGRGSLNRLFAASGWRTLAVMPAITLDWPESAWFGYDAVFAARDLGYRGPPFDWVTMPDQFTLAAMRRRIEAGRPARAMAEAALISSHAPWTPIPHLVPWEAVGDGSVFAPQVLGAVPPRVLWQDPERVRAAYGRSIDYALEAVFSYAARFGRDTVFVVLGDHQPAPLVTGSGASRDVPVHILSDDPAVLARLDGWGWTAGLLPDAEAPEWPMQAFRERFVRAMSGAPDASLAASSAAATGAGPSPATRQGP